VCLCTPIGKGVGVVVGEATLGDERVVESVREVVVEVRRAVAEELEVDVKGGLGGSDGEVEDSACEGAGG
jgi:hypothetical protein